MSIAYIRDVRKSLTSDYIIAQQANRYIVAFRIAISRYRRICSGLDIMGGL